MLPVTGCHFGLARTRTPWVSHEKTRLETAAKRIPNMSRCIDSADKEGFAVTADNMNTAIVIIRAGLSRHLANVVSGLLSS